MAQGGPVKVIQNRPNGLVVVAEFVAQIAGEGTPQVIGPQALNPEGLA